VVDPTVQSHYPNQASTVSFSRQLGWLLYVGIGWFAVALLSWCLLVVGARADHRDTADTARTEPGGEPARPPITGRFVPGRAVVDRSFVARRNRALARQTRISSLAPGRACIAGR
jgi:hypothetical protein